MASKGRPLGGNKIAQARLNIQKKTKVNSKSKAIKIQLDDDDTTYRCTCCGKWYNKQLNNFPVSSSPLFAGNNGYASICKSCLDKYYTKLVEFFSGNEEKAIERCCQILDWYFSMEAVAMTQKCMSAGKTRVSMYPSKVNMHQIKNKGTTFLDTIEERANDTIEDFEDLAKFETDNNGDENVFIPDKDTIIFWGSGYKPQEYQFLHDQYEDWTTRYESETKAQEELFKNICISQLSIQQAKQRGSIKDASDAMKTFQDLLGSANLKPNQNNSNNLVEQNTFGTLIKKWEDEQPIPEPSEEFKDVDNIKKYINTYFFGHLAKVMNIDNDYSRQYEEDIAQHTVVRQEYFEDLDTEEEVEDDS